MTHKTTKVLTIAALLGVLGILPSLAPTALAAGGNNGGCPSINAISNFLPVKSLHAGFTLDGTNSTATYTFTSPNRSPTNGVPGLIAYCVYPPNPPGLPASASASYSGWGTSMGVQQGYFAFVRPNGNPTNVPFDGNTYTIGTASWPTGTAPSTQTILLHINSQAICTRLYGSGSTCFVFPNMRTGGGEGEGF